jgi:hypothetical protein
MLWFLVLPFFIVNTVTIVQAQAQAETKPACETTYAEVEQFMTNAKQVKTWAGVGQDAKHLSIIFVNPGNGRWAIVTMDDQKCAKVEQFGTGYQFVVPEALTPKFNP